MRGECGVLGAWHGQENRGQARIAINVKGEKVKEQEGASHCLPKEAKLPNMAADGGSGAANDVGTAAADAKQAGTMNDVGVSGRRNRGQAKVPRGTTRHTVAGEYSSGVGAMGSEA